MFRRVNSVTSPPPRKPKIPKIPLPDMDGLKSDSPILRPTLSPRGPTNPTTMMTQGALPATGRTAPKPRGVHPRDTVPPMSGYCSEPGGGPSRPTHKKNVYSRSIPMQQEDGPSRSKVDSSTFDVQERRRGGSSGRNPKSLVAPPLNESSRTHSRMTDVNPPVVTPQVRPSAMKKKPSERPNTTESLVHANATPATKRGVLSPIPIRNRTVSYSSAAPEVRTTKTVNFLNLPNEEDIPNIHWQLLPFQPPKSKHCLHFDVSLPPTSITACGRRIKQEQFEKSAAASKLFEMVIQGDLRWKIIVRQRNSITCEDVFQAIYDTYDVPLTDMDRKDSDPKLLQRCEAAFKRRCEAVPRLSEREERIGMKRVDLLNGKTFFHGLTKADVDSPWKLELRHAPPCASRAYP